MARNDKARGRTRATWLAAAGLLAGSLPGTSQAAPSPVEAVAGQGLGAEQGNYSCPMEVIRGRPYVMAMVNGKGPFRFILDTGTGGRAVITPELAEQLDLDEDGEAVLNDPTGQGGQKAPLVLMDTLTIAGAEFEDIRAVVHKLPSMDGLSQGMLGFPLFRDYLLTLDYPNQKLELRRGELEQDGERSVLPFRMPDGVPVVTLSIGRLRVDAQIDSGGGGLSLPEQIASSLRFSEEPALFGKGQSLSTKFEIKVGKLIPDVQLGDVTLEQPWIEINPAFPLANFGAVPLEYFAVTFDQKNQLMRLKGTRKNIKLGITPAPARLVNEPTPPSDAKLVPVG